MVVCTLENKSKHITIIDLKEKFSDLHFTALNKASNKLISSDTSITIDTTYYVNVAK